jgi:hypothetical protein
VNIVLPVTASTLAVCSSPCFSARPKAATPGAGRR